MLCPICKQEIEDGSVFCPICGADLSKVSDQAEAAQPAEAEEEPVEDTVPDEVPEEVVTEAADEVVEEAPVPEAEPDEEVQDVVFGEDAPDAVSEEELTDGEISEEPGEGEAEPETFLEGDDASTEPAEGEAAPVPKKKKKGRFKRFLAIVLSILVLLDSGVLTYSIFFNDGNLPAVSVPTLVKTLKHKLKKNGEAYIWQIDLSDAEVNGTTQMGYTGDTFSFYTDPWIETFFSGDFKAIQDYDATYSAQGVSIDYCFDENAQAKVKELAGEYKETSTDYRIKEEDGVVTIVKVAKCANEDVAFVFQYNGSDGTILWEVGLED